jgi:AcrR family transcriptional regulator
MARHGGETSMQDVAGEAGMAPSSLYEHFTGKEELFTALHTELWQAFVATFEVPVPSGMSRRLALELLAIHHLRAVAAWHEALAAFPVVQATPRLVRTVRDRANRYHVLLADWLVAHAGIARASAGDAAIVVSGILQGFQQRWLRGGAKGDPAKMAPLVARYLAAALV